MQLSSPSPSPVLPGSHQACLLFYKKYFINPFFLWLDYCKNNAFSKQTRFILSTYCWSVLILLFCAYVFIRVLFVSSSIMTLRIALYLHISIASYLTSHQIMWHNKRINVHGLKITSIILSYLYHFWNVNKKIFR